MLLCVPFIYILLRSFSLVSAFLLPMILFVMKRLQCVTPGNIRALVITFLPHYNLCELIFLCNYFISVHNIILSHTTSAFTFTLNFLLYFPFALEICLGVILLPLLIIVNFLCSSLCNRLVLSGCVGDKQTTTCHFIFPTQKMPREALVRLGF